MPRWPRWLRACLLTVHNTVGNGFETLYDGHFISLRTFRCCCYTASIHHMGMCTHLYMRDQCPNFGEAPRRPRRTSWNLEQLVWSHIIVSLNDETGDGAIESLGDLVSVSLRPYHQEPRRWAHKSAGWQHLRTPPPSSVNPEPLMMMMTNLEVGNFPRKIFDPIF